MKFTDTNTLITGEGKKIRVWDVRISNKNA